MKNEISWWAIHDFPLKFVGGKLRFVRWVVSKSMTCQVRAQWMSAKKQHVSSDVHMGIPQSDDVSSDVCTWWSCLRCSPRTPRRRAPQSWCTYVETRRTGPILAREREDRVLLSKMSEMASYLLRHEDVRFSSEISFLILLCDQSF
jgi:hypothetical protein